MTLNNSCQKINDVAWATRWRSALFIWRVTNTAKAVFNVDNYSTCPCSDMPAQRSAHLPLRCSSQRTPTWTVWPMRQPACLGSGSKAHPGRDPASPAGIEIISPHHLSGLPPRDAAVMLQRQQASAIIDAQDDVDGAGYGGDGAGSPE